MLLTTANPVRIHRVSRYNIRVNPILSVHHAKSYHAHTSLRGAITLPHIITGFLTMGAITLSHLITRLSRQGDIKLPDPSHPELSSPNLSYALLGAGRRIPCPRVRGPRHFVSHLHEYLAYKATLQTSICMRVRRTQVPRTIAHNNVKSGTKNFQQDVKKSKMWRQINVNFVLAPTPLFAMRNGKQAEPDAITPVTLDFLLQICGLPVFICACESWTSPSLLGKSRKSLSEHLQDIPAKGRKRQELVMVTR